MAKPWSANDGMGPYAAVSSRDICEYGLIVQK
jgi:hypothetical protein